MVAPAPGNTPTINPRIEERGIVTAICLVSSLFTLIDPKSVKEICFAALEGSFPLIIIVKASLIANVAITTKTKLIPSDKFILLNVNLGISERVSWPTLASINPSTTNIIAFKKCPLAEKAEIDYVLDDWTGRANMTNAALNTMAKNLRAFGKGTVAGSNLFGKAVGQLAKDVGAVNTNNIKKFKK